MTDYAQSSDWSNNPSYENTVAYLLKHGPQTTRAKELGRKLGQSQAFYYITLFGFTNKHMA